MLSLLHSKGPAITLFITLSGRNKLKILDKSLKKKKALIGKHVHFKKHSFLISCMQVWLVCILLR